MRNCFESVQLKRTSIRCSPSSLKRRRNVCSTRRSPVGSRRSSLIPPKGSGVRFDGPSGPVRTGPREDGPIDRVRRAAWELAQWRDFAAPWTRDAFDRDGDIDRLIAELHSSPLSREAVLREGLPVSRHRCRAASESGDRSSSVLRSHDYDGWEARLVDLPAIETSPRRGMAVAPVTGRA